MMRRVVFVLSSYLLLGCEGDAGGSSQSADTGGQSADAADADSTLPADVSTGPDLEQQDVVEIPEPTAPQLGNGDGTPQSVTLRVIVGEKWLESPTDLDFNPLRPGEVWITNRESDSFTVVVGPGTPGQNVQKLYDYTQHFAEEVIAISFSDNNTFGTCGDTNNTYGGLAQGDNFMGPVWWSDDIELFQQETVQEGGAHIDMLHNSPFCMGIASAGDDAFYAFNGDGGHIDYYKFGEPHVPGGDDHSDGVKLRIAKGVVKRVPGVPSHMIWDAKAGYLYVADTGNSRIIRVDTQSGTKGKLLFSNPDPHTTFHEVNGTVVDTLIDQADGAFIQPSGLTLHDGILFVSDHQTGVISAFTLDGKKINDLDTGRGANAVGGLAVGDDGFLYFTDMLRNEVLRIEP